MIIELSLSPNRHTQKQHPYRLCYHRQGLEHGDCTSLHWYLGSLLRDRGRLDPLCPGEL